MCLRPWWTHSVCLKLKIWYWNILRSSSTCFSISCIKEEMQVYEKATGYRYAFANWNLKKNCKSLLMKRISLFNVGNFFWENWDKTRCWHLSCCSKQVQNLKAVSLKENVLRNNWSPSTWNLKVSKFKFQSHLNSAAIKLFKLLCSCVGWLSCEILLSILTNVTLFYVVPLLLMLNEFYTLFQFVYFFSIFLVLISNVQPALNMCCRRFSRFIAFSCSSSTD